jgi:cytochrome c-type biogenesis protein
MYITGTSLAELTSSTRSIKWKIVLNSLAFVTGFSLLFIAFGLSASTIGQLLSAYQIALRKISGLVIIMFGLHLTGILHIKWLDQERRLQLATKSGNPVSSLILGLAFSAGWTPCIGPILASILLLASNTDTIWQGGYLLSVYSLGLAIPFLAMALSLGFSMKWFKSFEVHLSKVNIASGILLIVTGIMVYANVFTKLSSYFNWGF